MRVLPLSEVKAKLSGLVSELAETEEEVIITRNGRAAAVLLSAREYEGWKETLELRKNPGFLREIRSGIRALKHGKGKRYRSVAAFIRDSR